jgi:hypothetical protein
MTTHSVSLPPNTYRIGAHSGWVHAWKVAAVVSAVGCVGMAVGYSGDHRRFAFSYLFAFMTALTVCLGGLFFVMIQHITGASWSVAVRRIPEFLASAMPLFAILVVPILLNVHTLYPWSNHGGGHGSDHSSAHASQHAAGPALGHAPGHRQEHGSAHATQVSINPSAGHASPEHALHEAVISAKTPYLNTRFFLIRAGVYLLVWVLLWSVFFRASVRQDETKSIQSTVVLKRWAAPGLFLLALTSTFAAVDWVMSLEPAWFSTIFGVYTFANSILAAVALTIVLALALQGSGYLARAINLYHYHDLGKLLFGFLVFWAYIGFSQLLLIWYASIPEETSYYHLRWHAGWKETSMLLVVAKFVVPFFFLLSRNIKRRTALLQFAAAWLLVMHVVEMYWFVLPYDHEGVFHLSMLDAACLLAVVGAYAAWVLRTMTRHALVPVGDPRIQRSMQFHGA